MCGGKEDKAKEQKMNDENEKKGVEEIREGKEEKASEQMMNYENEKMRRKCAGEKKRENKKR